MTTLYKSLEGLSNSNNFESKSQYKCTYYTLVADTNL